MRKVELRMNEQMKYEIIRRVAFKEISVHRAAVQLNCTVRTVYNLVKKYREHGKAGFIHGNRNRKPAATMSPKLEQTIVSFYMQKCEGANFLHFQELLEEIKGIKVSYFKLYALLRKHGIISPKCHRITRKKHTQETLKGYYNIFHQVLTKYGIPAKILADNRSIFNYKLKNSHSKEKDTHTQFGYACHRLGVDLDTTSVAQAKGRIERMFGTLQSRLVTELKMAGIFDIDAANEFLKDFVPKFNERFALPIDYLTSVFDENIDQETINNTLAVISARKVDNGNTIKYKNKYYHLYDFDGNMMPFKPKTVCIVMETYDGSLIASVNDDLYGLVELEVHHEFSKNFDTKKPEKKRYTGHKPKDCHPWTYKSYLARKRRRYKSRAETLA
ncbi:MAG: helix-turn-helix domain-containing protein [Bacilli bacterium]